MIHTNSTFNINQITHIRGKNIGHMGNLVHNLTTSEKTFICCNCNTRFVMTDDDLINLIYECKGGKRSIDAPIYCKACSTKYSSRYSERVTIGDVINLEALKDKLTEPIETPKEEVKPISIPTVTTNDDFIIVGDGVKVSRRNVDKFIKIAERVSTGKTINKVITEAEDDCFIYRCDCCDSEYKVTKKTLLTRMYLYRDNKELALRKPFTCSTGCLKMLYNHKYDPNTKTLDTVEKMLHPIIHPITSNKKAKPTIINNHPSKLVADTPSINEVPIPAPISGPSIINTSSNGNIIMSKVSIDSPAGITINYHEGDNVSVTVNGKYVEICVQLRNEDYDDVSFYLPGDRKDPIITD